MGLWHLKGLGLALAGLLAGVALIAAACGGDESDEASAPTSAATATEAAATDGPLSIVASTTIIADIVGQVAGDRAEVVSTVPSGADPHTFTLAPSDIRRATDADLVVIVGANLSAIEDDLADSASGSVLVLTEGMDLRPFPEGLAHEDDHGDEEGHGDEEAEDEDHHGDEEAEEGDHGDEEAEDEDHHGDEEGEEDDHGDEEGEDRGDEHGHGEFDPHFWMDIDFVIQAVEAIRDELTHLDPDGAGYYRDQAAAYIEELRELDEEIAEMLSALPESRRYLVTFHDAFGYFADRYGLTILGFVVEGPEEEPSASAITELVESIRELEIPFIFTEPQFSARVIEQIASDTGASVRTIPSGALGEDFPTYVEFLRAIARGIAE